MIKGIFIFETGGIQLIGELNSLQGIINTIEKILPDLKKQERERIFNTMSVEEIAALIKDKESGKAEK